MVFSGEHHGVHRDPGDLTATAWGLRAAGAAIAGLILLAGWSGYHLLSQMRQQLLDQGQSATALLRRSDGLDARCADLQHQLQQAVARHQRAMARVPATADETEFLKQLAAIARQTQLEIRDYRPGRVSGWPTHSEVELAVRAAGSYESFCHFLAALDDLPRVCRVSQLTIGAPERPGQPSVIDFQIALTFGLSSATPVAGGDDAALASRHPGGGR